MPRTVHTSMKKGPPTYRYTSVVHILCKIKYEGLFMPIGEKIKVSKDPYLIFDFFWDILCFDSDWLVWIYSETSDFDRFFSGFDLVH